MTEELVKFETAQLALDKGCNLKSDFYYDLGNGNKLSSGYNDSYGYQQRGNNLVVPTYSQSLLQKWLRDEFKIFIDVEASFNEKKSVRGFSYLAYTCVDDRIEYQLNSLDGVIVLYASYEQALEQGLIESLNLIK